MLEVAKMHNAFAFHRAPLTQAKGIAVILGVQLYFLSFCLQPIMCKDCLSNLFEYCWYSEFMHKRQKKKRAKQSSWEVIEHEIFGGFAAHYSTQANLDLLLWKQMIH